MKTTELFVELIVIGYGMMIWLGLLVSTIFSESWLNLNNLLSIQSILPSLVIAYVFGIITDRQADYLFKRWDRNIRGKLFPHKFDYQQARTLVFDKSESLKAWFYYGRSRIRICRGWTLNFLFIALFLNIYIFFGKVYNLNVFSAYIFSNTCLFILVASTIFSWYRLTSSEYERLSQEYKNMNSL